MDWIKFAKETRTTTFFRDYAIAEIKVAYRIMEYLAPDDCFPPKIDEITMTLIKNEHFSEALKRIIGYEIDYEIDSAHWSQELNGKGIEMMESLYLDYKQKKTSEKEIKRQKLLKELEELDKEEVE